MPRRAATADELEAFKIRVVEVAMEEGRKRHWCSELQRVLARDLGLGDYIPHEFVVQMKQEGQRWADYQSSVATAQVALENVTQYRRHTVAQAREQWRYRRDNLDSSSSSIQVRLELTSNRETMARRIALAEEEARQKLAELAAINAPFVEPEYPIYRVVERRYGSKRNLRVVEAEA